MILSWGCVALAFLEVKGVAVILLVECVIHYFAVLGYGSQKCSMFLVKILFSDVQCSFVAQFF